MSRAFRCNDSARLLGFPSAEVGSCIELLPGLWRVVLKGPCVAPEGARIDTFVWNDGARSTAVGPQALAAYLKSINAHALETVDPYAVQILLEATAGAPPGFTAGSVSGRLDGILGAVTTRPFGVTLVQPHWSKPVDPSAQPDLGQPPTPAADGPLGSPLGAPPSGVGPAAGYAPPLVARATLTLDADYEGVWTVATRRPFAQTFETVLTLAVAP